MLPSFDPATLDYSKELPYGTTTVPTVGATTTDPNASKVITQAASVTGTATVVVTAEDGTTQKTYTVAFSVAANNDATLSDLTVDVTTIAGFDPATLDYSKELPYGTTTVPTVGATTTDPNASKNL
jgi:VCBS repeat-containing protein